MFCYWTAQESVTSKTVVVTKTKWQKRNLLTLISRKFNISCFKIKLFMMTIIGYCLMCTILSFSISEVFKICMLGKLACVTNDVYIYKMTTKLWYHNIFQSGK